MRPVERCLPRKLRRLKERPDIGAAMAANLTDEQRLCRTQNKLDLGVGIAIGSAAQIALFVSPVLVLFGYVIGPTPMDSSGQARWR